MSTTELQLASTSSRTSLPARPPPPATSLPSELLFHILWLATQDTQERHEPAEHQQTRNDFSGVCRGWYGVATASPELMVEGPVKGRRLATLLREKQRKLPAVKILHLAFVDTCNEWDEEEEELYERRACMSDILAACPNVEHLSLDMRNDDDAELGPRLLDALQRCTLSTFTILGPCSAGASDVSVSSTSIDSDSTRADHLSR
jgi:hypothetical protein